MKEPFPEIPNIGGLSKDTKEPYSVKRSG